MSQTQGLKRTRKSAGARTPVRAWRQAVLSLGIALPLAAWAQASPTVPGVPTARNAARPPAAPASVPTIVEAEPVVENSYLDGALLKQLLLAEFALRDGQPGDAVELILEAARRNKDDALFRRALQIAVEAGSGDKALAITKTLAPDDAPVDRSGAHPGAAAVRARSRPRDRRAAPAAAVDEHTGRAVRADREPAARRAARAGQGRRRGAVPRAAQAVPRRAGHPHRRPRRARPHAPGRGQRPRTRSSSRRRPRPATRRRSRRCCWRSTS